MRRILTVILVWTFTIALQITDLPKNPAIVFTTWVLALSLSAYLVFGWQPFRRQLGGKRPMVMTGMVALIGALIYGTANWVLVERHRSSSDNQAITARDIDLPQIPLVPNESIRDKQPSASDDKREPTIRIEQNTQGGPAAVTTGPSSPITINPEVNPNQQTVTYDCLGNKRITGPTEDALLGINLVEDTSAWVRLSTLNNEGDWHGLLSAAEEYMKERPEWLTPYLFASASYLGLGEFDKGREMFARYDRQAGPSYRGGDCERLVTHINTFLQGK